MPTPKAHFAALLALLASLAAASGCASHQAAAPVPAGMKVGGALTQAQIHAIQVKRQGSGAPPTQ